MGYYLGGRGDYYALRGRGDYYGRGRGDLGGFLRKAAGVGLRIAGAVGIPGAGLLGGVLGGGGGGGSSSTRVSIQPPTIGPVRLGPSFEVERYQGTRGSVDFPMSHDGGAPRGYHLAKDGSGRYVKNRHMNPANPAALRRAIRRQDGFVQLAARVGMVRKRTATKPLKFGKARKR